MKPKYFLIIVLAMIVVGYFGRSLLNADHKIPEANAGLDTATMLMVYLQSHNDRWPASWDDLLTVVDAIPGKELTLRGAPTNTLPYAQTLKTMVAINWAFDPSHPDASIPLTRVDGSPLPVVWSGADPNLLIRDFLKHEATTRAIAATQP